MAASRGEELLAAAGLDDDSKEPASDSADESAEGDEYTPSAGEILAAEEALEAKGAGDAEAFARAICHLIDMHKAGG
jgi:hypothetical protein